MSPFEVLHELQLLPCWCEPLFTSTTTQRRSPWFHVLFLSVCHPYACMAVFTWFQNTIGSHVDSDQFGPANLSHLQCLYKLSKGNISTSHNNDHYAFYYNAIYILNKPYCGKLTCYQVLLKVPGWCWRDKDRSTNKVSGSKGKSERSKLRFQRSEIKLICGAADTPHETRASLC